MIKRLFVLLAVPLACGDTSGYEYTSDPETGELQEVELGAAEQAYVVQTTYGIRNDLANGLESTHWRPCGPGNPAGQQCFYPSRRNIGLGLDTDGIASNDDRDLWEEIKEDAVDNANGGDNGFNYRNSCGVEDLCVIFQPQAPFNVPSDVPSNHIRRYVGFFPLSVTLTNGVGGDKLFRDVFALGDFEAMRAFKGGGACTATNACGQGMRHMVTNVLALATGYGLLSTTSAQGRGVDTNVEGNMLIGENITGTPCQLLQSDAFNPNNPGTKNIFDPECSE